MQKRSCLRVETSNGLPCKILRLFWQIESKLKTLDQGDMLIIPPGWWHSVRSLDLSISVNIWTPSPARDEKAREIEAATRIVSQICAKSGLVRFLFFIRGNFTKNFLKILLVLNRSSPAISVILNCYKK